MSDQESDPSATSNPPPRITKKRVKASSAKENKGLSPKQARFVEEYVVDLNATDAARRAGYSAKTAEQQGPRLLGNVGVSRAIASAKETRARVTGITQQRVVDELALLAFSNLKNFVLTDKGDVTLALGADESVWRSVASIKRKSRVLGDSGVVEYEVEMKFWDKPGTLKLAGRHVDVAGFFEKMEVTGKNGGPLSVEDARDPSRMTTKEREARLAELLAKEGQAPNAPK